MKKTPRFKKFIKTFAKNRDVSTKTANKKWKETEKQVAKNIDKDEEHDKFYGTVVNIMKKKLKTEAIEKTSQDQIRNLQDKLRIMQKQYNLDVTTIRKKISDLQAGKPVDIVAEDGDAAITTASIGGSAIDQSGNTIAPAVGNNAAYVPSYMGTVSRFGAKQGMKQKRKLRKEGFENYLDNLLME